MDKEFISLTADSVVFTRDVEGRILVLLIQRKSEPFKGGWALPGGFVDYNENLEDAAMRELQEETRLNVDAVRQIGAFGDPDRDPRKHTVSVAYWAEVPPESMDDAKGGDDAEDAKWFHVDELPQLGFDHDKILDAGLDAFRKYKGDK